MKDIILNKEAFMLFNEFDQFGFFYNDEGYPDEDAQIKFADNVAALFTTYQYIVVDSGDNIYGLNNSAKTLLMECAIEAYDIAREAGQE